MQIVPVIDLRGGKVVHGRAGHRESYGPIQSRLTSSAEPLEVLRVLTEACQAKTAYVAELDGLMNQAADRNALRELADQPIGLIIDSGIRSVADVDQLPCGDHVQLVLASETIPSEQMLRAIVARHPTRRFVFSFDLADDVLRTPIAGWRSRSVVDLASLVWQLGVADWIVLDVRSVGMTTGPTTHVRCAELKSQFPGARLTTGGGIRNRADLQALKDLGVSEVLLASALHDRSITKADLEGLG